MSPAKQGDFIVSTKRRVARRDKNPNHRPVSLSLEHPRFNEEFIRLVEENASIAECHYIAGDFDFILKVITKNGKTLEAVLNYIKSINGVSLTRTSVVLTTNKCEISLLPD